MKHLSFFQTAACAAVLFVALSPRAVRADDWDQRSVLTFSDTVQVPGAILPAGTYVFRLRDSKSDRYTVQILNERENHMYATVLAIPDYRDTAPEKTMVSFYETPAGQPMPVKAWFYPGNKYGREFVYKRNEAALIAAAAKETVPSEETVATAETQPAQPVAEQPAPEPAAPAEVTKEETTAAVTEPEPAPVTHSEEATTDHTASAEPVPEPIAEQAPEQAPDQTPDETTTLPSTGSEWPLAGLIGLSSLAGALGLRAMRRSS